MAGRFFMMAIAVAILSACAASPAGPGALDALAPTGTLRAAIIVTTSLQVTDYEPGVELKGVSVDLGRALAQRIGVPFSPVPYQNISALMKGLEAGQWDVAFFAIDPSREKVVDFAAPYMDVELGLMVNGASPLRSMADADRAGVRVAVAASGGTDILLSRSVKQATLVRAPDLAAAVNALRDGKADALAANKPTLYAEAGRVPAARILDGSFASVQYAMATPKGHAAANAELRRFVETARSDGTVRSAIDRSGLRGIVVSAPQ